MKRTQFSNKKILVIGDIILDHYIHGSVNRISPEAPIPIFDKERFEYILGGAANVARNLKALGAGVWFSGRIGDDLEGEIVKKLLCDEKVYCQYLLKDPKLRTTVKTRYVSGSQQMLRVDSEDRNSMEGTLAAEELIEALDRHSDFFDAIIISDYCKGVVFDALLSKIQDIKKKNGTVVTADTHRKNLAHFSGFTAITPNRKEASEILNAPVKDQESYEWAAEALTKQYRLDQVLLTLSEDGLLLRDSKFYTNYSESLMIPAKNKDIVDVTGAGDTVIAAYTLALVSGYTPFRAAAFANNAAAVVVGKMGTATATLEEVMERSKDDEG